MGFKLPVVLACCAAACLASIPGCGGLEQAPYDVVVVGDTPSGICAAVAAARKGCRVCLVAEQEHLGGMMASGLGSTDAGRPELIGGLAREVFGRIAGHYEKTYGRASRQFGQCRHGLRFEPHVAEEVFDRLAARPGITVLKGRRFIDCLAADNRITAILLRSRLGGGEQTVYGKFFVDATYTGDFLALAGEPFRTGREDREFFGESMAGHIFQHDKTHLPLPGSTGLGDSLVQAYNYRLCLTDSAGNSAPLPGPVNYDPERYRILYRYLRQKGAASPADFMIFSPLPNRKYDINNWGYCWLSTDLIGGSQAYPEAEARQRQEIEKRHLEHVLGLMRFLRTDPGLPEALRREFARYNPAADEFADNRHLPFQLYVREARRLASYFTFTERDALVDTLKEDAIGMGSYPMDSHATGAWDYGYPFAEGFFILPCRPYQIPYRVMLPRWTRNLLVSACVSASHVAYGTLRMEPVYMIMGQAAGEAAALCIDFNCEADQVPVNILQEKLRESGAILSAAEAIPWPGKPDKPDV
ncbi:MAG: FAD-dependent oxidoreductase [Candidatus Glassbacteria bacterium]|nr:FAD-dependent oxidoreductase [Candidatus Glassbacteria bacterium]